MKAILIAAATLSAFALSPASAAMMKCTSANMAKTTTAMNTLQDGPAKTEMGKHMALANAAISKGDMRGGFGRAAFGRRGFFMRLDIRGNRIL